VATSTSGADHSRVEHVPRDRRAPIARLVQDRRALVLAVVIAVLVAVIVADSGAGADAPATGAAAVVPSDALAYLHVSTDSGRPAVKRALALAERFPDFPLLREGLLVRLSSITSSSGTIPGAIDFSSDIRPWLGKEAALALLNTTTSSPASLIVLDVTDLTRARRFLTRFGPAGQTSYRGTAIQRFGLATETAFVGHYLVIGNDPSVRAAIDTSSGRSPSLQGNSAYQRAVSGESDGRVIDAYASLDGVRRLLVSRRGLAGALGALLYQPALDGVSVALTPQPGGVDVRVHSAFDARLAALQRNANGSGEFSPTLPSSIPAGATLMLDLTRLDQAAPRILGAAAAGGVGGGVLPLLRRLGAALQAEGVDVKRDILSIFHTETVVAIVPTGGGSSAGASGAGASSGSAPGAGIFGGLASGTNANGRPALVIVARAPNEQQTRAALAALELPLAQLFPPPSNGPGQAPVFNDRQVAGITARQLALAAGLELDYAVFDGKLVISTSLQGIAGVRRHARALVDDPAYRATLGNHPNRVTSLLFLDFNQLLSLGEQTGLIRGARYRALRPDLRMVRAIGLSSTNGEADSTAELSLQIP
jgi:uncharacterized protein DUF3352